MSNVFKKEKEISKQLNNLQISKSHSIRALLTGLVFGVVIMIIPILICINLFLIYQLVPFLVVLLGIFIEIMAVLCFYFNFEALKNYDNRVKEINTKYLLIFNSIVIAIILTIVIIVTLILLTVFKVI